MVKPKPFSTFSSLTGLTQNLGKQWKQLGEHEKAVYQEEAERLRLLHQKEYPDYKYRPKKRTRSGGSEQVTAVARVKQEQEDGALPPKRPLGGFEGEERMKREPQYMVTCPESPQYMFPSNREFPDIAPMVPSSPALYDSDSSFTFYEDMVAPTPIKEDFSMGSMDTLTALPDMDSEQRVELMSELLESPLTPEFRPYSIYNQSVTTVVSYTPQPPIHPSTPSISDTSVIRNLSMYFNTQHPEVEMSTSPTSSSSTLSEQDTYTPHMAGVQDLLLYNNNHRVGIPSYEERGHGQEEVEAISDLTVSDWVERTLSDVICFDY